MVQHISYPKIPTAEQFGGTAVGGPWVATEKVHGAQLVVACDGRDVSVGKRKAWLRGDEPFFGWQLLRRNLEQAAKIALSHSGGASVRVFGELYGGRYPHPDVPPASGAAAVQTGIWYSPDVRFALFDVLSHDDADDPGVFQPYAHVAAIADAAGLDVVPLLGRGTRSALDALPQRFPSRVPHVLGLPELPDNLAEGIVLRPDTPCSPEQRPIIKMKIDEFDEQRFDQSRPWDPQVRLPLADLCHIGRAMVNPARLASARSKVGPADLDELLDEVILDVMVDLSEAFPAAVAVLTDEEEAELHDVIRAATAGDQV
ncbi:RNA ligase family protein [Lentzea tibetensis]|uniref:RNA ligase family protein n=1 Tax=Lentzea tibetensis TaxID=2591470 RepID=UPI001646C9AE|nr:RNA ligase family protein [Lentzea tibetensis]